MSCRWIPTRRSYTGGDGGRFQGGGGVDDDDDENDDAEQGAGYHYHYDEDGGVGEEKARSTAGRSAEDDHNVATA